jgi:hypothetical protein
VASAVEPSGRREPSAASKLSTIDLAALGNLCVDAFVEDVSLPLPADTEYRRGLLSQLLAAPEGTYRMEVGGNCNLLIAAARLGLSAASVGHVTPDFRGHFLCKVLQDEGIRTVHRMIPDTAEELITLPGTSGRVSTSAAPAVPSSSGPRSGGGESETLVCFVLCDNKGQHAFCSRYDFGPWPFLSSLKTLPKHSREVLKRSRSCFINGFV